MAKRHQEHQSMEEVLKSFVSDNNLQKGLDKVAVRDVWEKIMGPAITKYTRNIKLERETVYVELTSSVLREELSYGRQKIIDNLNDELGKVLVKKLVLR
ncbi:hypothetical protein IWQ47_000384 [Aquimarina sp. EL_43]|uniref:DUF721 domain-containing protein n=1 Tax=Aquimarina TaxID=290174 RepID=UPI0009430258|nr:MULTISPECIES: DUF721 domain-containing protein [Aquimarina]MBG6128923.1 hypothetical protein [Aquimarina sp. EL_35]MBG6149987.1 hypothetical protein [Aquimarina sp. EL_32]MBG6167326.1 hypothetical protein [Aquimarina sp. EL_43]